MPTTEELRAIASAVADRFADQGYAFVEDGDLDLLAAALAEFLEAVHVSHGDALEGRVS